MWLIWPFIEVVECQQFHHISPSNPIVDTNSSYNTGTEKLSSTVNMSAGQKYGGGGATVDILFLCVYMRYVCGQMIVLRRDAAGFNPNIS